uniref:Granulins domain-containing protein n=1 Tax=Esox lucius TaxID=8010 RepID=A0A3P8YZP1_ESOLU
SRGVTLTCLQYLGVVAGSATCYITCSNGKVCSDQSTCCLTDQGYECCPVPNAVCCPDMAHCCPPGFRCDITTQMCERENRPQSIIPTLRKMAAKEPNSPISPPHEFDSSPVPSDVTESSAGALVQCDNVGSCPDGTTCCLHRYGLDLRFPPQGRCCLDGNHCCPSGFDCDFSFSKCVRNDNLRYPFVRMQKPSVMEAIKVSKLAGKVHDQVHQYASHGWGTTAHNDQEK